MSGSNGKDNPAATSGPHEGPIACARRCAWLIALAATIALISPTGASAAYQQVAAWGSYGWGEGEFYSPSGVAVDKDGYVYVADTYNYRIQKFTSSGAFVGKWGTPDSPFGVAVDNAGYVYVADTFNNRIQKFTSGGAFLEQWGSGGSGKGELSSPHGMAVDKYGYVYVADSGNNRIQKFTSSGGFVDEWGNDGSNEKDLNAPSGVAAAQDEHGEVGYVYLDLYVADTFNNLIQKFSSSGTLLDLWGGKGSGEGELYSPSGVAASQAGTVHVADTLNNRIQKFTSSGSGATFVAEWGSLGSGDGKLSSPSGVAADQIGYVYVADTGNHRVVVLADLSETPKPPPPTPGAPPAIAPHPLGPKAADTTAPRLRLKVSGKRVRSAKLRRSPTKALFFKVALSESAKTTISLYRKVKAGTTSKRKSRLTRVGSFKVSAKAGTSKVKIPKRLARKLARVATYGASAQATDAAGNRSAVARVSFRVVR